MIRKIFIALGALFLAVLSLNLYQRLKPISNPNADRYVNEEHTTTPAPPNIPEIDETVANRTNAPEYLDFNDVLRADDFKDLDADIRRSLERYRVHTQALCWFDAVSKCWRDGGHIAIPSDDAEAQQLGRLLTFAVTHADIADTNTTDAMHVGVWYHFLLDYLPNNEENSHFGYEGWLNHRGSVAIPTINAQTGVAILPNGRLIAGATYQKLIYACDTEPMKKIPPRLMGEGYEFVDSEVYAYKMHVSPATWFDALDVCESEGGILAMPFNDKGISNLVAWVFAHKDLPPQAANGGVFFGLNDLAKEKDWMYPQGFYMAPYNMNWLRGGEKEDRTRNCAALEPSGGCIVVPCSEARPFVCQKRNSSPPKEEEGKYEEVAGKGFYALHAKKRRWWEAVLTCRAENATLAAPDSAEEVQLLTELVERATRNITRNITRKTYVDKNLYVGVQDLDRDKIWRTIDGKRVYGSGFNEWLRGYNDVRYRWMDEGFVGVLENGKYDYNSGLYECMFVCKKPPK